MCQDEESRLIDAVRETIERYARRLTRDHALAEDLSQIGLLRVVRWARLKNGSPTNAEGWAVRTAINAMLSMLTRSIRRVQDSEIPVDIEILAECFAGPDDPRTCASAIELALVVRGRLGERARALFDEMIEVTRGPRNGAGPPYFKPALCGMPELQRAAGLAKATAWRARNEIQRVTREVLAGAPSEAAA